MAEIPFSSPVFTEKSFVYQEIIGKAMQLHRLGLNYSEICKSLGVNDKTAKKAILYALKR